VGLLYTVLVFLTSVGLVWFFTACTTLDGVLTTLWVVMGVFICLGLEVVLLEFDDILLL
tara:strand:+ start:670 stop:846 length:177 start_codon:yes stop_codon:yes gene_type:complete